MTITDFIKNEGARSMSLHKWAEVAKVIMSKQAEALEKIATYDHVPGCEAAKYYAPVYECCGGSEEHHSQWVLAQDALKKLGVE